VKRVAKAKVKAAARAILLSALMCSFSAPAVAELLHSTFKDTIVIEGARDATVIEIAQDHCSSCAHLEIHNPTSTPLAIVASLIPQPLIPAEDRSLGGWIYSYSHELLAIDGDVSMAPEDGTQSVQGFASRRRFDLRAVTFSGDARDYVPGSYSVDIILPAASQITLTAYDGKTIGDNLAGSSIQDFLYWSLWSPLRTLCLGVERAISHLLPTLGAFGVILLIVLAVRAITFPINRWSFRSQKAFEAVQQEIAPQIAEIKSRLKGGDQSEAILELYQSRGVNPLSGLKGSVGLFVQIPILIAMFNVASESAILSGVPMGWVPDTAWPEHTANWGLDIPLLGKYLNVIALGLAAFMLWSELTKDERSTGTLVFAVAVGFLLYSFPAFLVVYWLLITIAQYVEQKLATR